jgi:hypothetical protein
MLKQICFFMAILAIAQSAPVQGTFKELPCLGKHAGDRLPHPDDPHKFLRCVTADSAWIETCPSKLFYNPHSQICDWDTLEKITTTTVVSTTVAHDQAVLVRFRPRIDMVDGVVGRSGLEATVIQEDQLGSSTPRPDTLLTIAPVRPVVGAPSNSVASQQDSPVFASGVTPALEIIQTTPKAEFVLPVESTTVTPIQPVATTTGRISDLEVIGTSTTPIVQFEVITTVAPVNTIAPVTEAPVVVVSTTTVAAQSIDDQSNLQKVQLQQRVQELQQELIRVQQQMQPVPVAPVVLTTTPVARFNNF